LKEKAAHFHVASQAPVTRRVHRPDVKP
jgi:hypothetical protein